MKNVNYKNIKRINSSSDLNLQKFDLGKRVNLFSGYQAGESLDTTQFDSTPSQSFLPLADSIKSTIAPTAVTGATNFLTQAATTALNVPAVASLFGLKTASTAANAGANAASSAGSAASSAGGALGALGPMMAIGGLAQGGIGLANAIGSFNDPIVSSSDALNSMGKSTLTKYGEAYTTYTGLDRQSIENVVDQANKAGKTNITLNGATTGGSAGALIGLAGGPIGSLIGFGIGSLIGAIGSWFGGESAAEKRRKRIERMLDNVEYATTNYNTNEESEAASRGMRNIFNSNHYAADEGKDVYTNFGEPGRIKMVHTSNGIEPGVELGVAGGKESIVNFKENTASVIEEGKKRVDNISVGVPLSKARGAQYDNTLYTADTGKEDWDNNVFIAGNVENPYTGNTIAEDAEPYARNVEKINKLNPMTNLGKKTKEINLRNQMLQLKWLSDIQSAVKDAESYFANCGKTPKYDGGKDGYIVEDVVEDNNKKKFKWPNLSGFGEYATILMPHLARLGTILSNKPDRTIWARNPYVASDYGKYIDAMLRNKIDNSQLLKEIEKAGRANAYMLNQFRGHNTPGQIAALLLQNNLLTTAMKNKLIADTDEKNIALKNSALLHGAQFKFNDATRKQSGNSEYDKAHALAGSSVTNSVNKYYTDIANSFGPMANNLLAMLQYNQARAWQNKKIDLFDKALDSNVFNQLNNLLA